MDLTFQVPMQYSSLQHWTLLSPPNTSTTEHLFHFGPTSSFFLELLVIVLCSSRVAYWPWGHSSSGIISFCLFKLFMKFLQQEYWSVLLFPPPVGHVLSELFIMTGLSWVTLHGLADSFTDFCRPLHHDKTMIYEGGGEEPKTETLYTARKKQDLELTVTQIISSLFIANFRLKLKKVGKNQ